MERKINRAIGMSHKPILSRIRGLIHYAIDKINMLLEIDLYLGRCHMKLRKVSEYIQYFKLKSTLGYYNFFLYLILRRVLNSLQFNNHKFPLNNIMTIKFKGIKGIVRSNHEDMLYYSWAAKLYFTESLFIPQLGENVIDVSSNVGRYSLIAAKKGTNIIIIEANLQTFKVLLDNCKINEFKNIKPMNVAISNRTGHFILSYFEGYDGIVSVDKKWSELDGLHKPAIEIEVQSDKLDNINSFNKIDWLLIDVEEHEVEVSESSFSTLSITNRIIIEVEH